MTTPELPRPGKLFVVLSVEMIVLCLFAIASLLVPLVHGGLHLDDVNLINISSAAVCMVVIWTQYSSTFRAHPKRAAMATVMLTVTAVGSGILLSLVVIGFVGDGLFNRQNLRRLLWPVFGLLAVTLSTAVLARLNHEWRQTLIRHNVSLPPAQISLRELLVFVTAIAFLTAAITWMLPP